MKKIVFTKSITGVLIHRSVLGTTFKHLFPPGCEVFAAMCSARQGRNINTLFGEWYSPQARRGEGLKGSFTCHSALVIFRVHSKLAFRPCGFRKTV